MITVHDGTLPAHARVTEEDPVLVLVGQTGQGDDSVGLPLPAAAVMNGLPDHFKFRAGAGFDQHRARGAGIAAGLV